MPLSRCNAYGLNADHQDLQGARAWMADICGPHSLRASASHPFEFKHSATRLGSLATVVGRIQYGTDVVIGVDASCGLKSYSISLPLDGQQEIRQGKTVLQSDTRVGLIVSPFEHQQLSIAADCRKLQVVITCASMNQVLQQLLQRPVDTPISFNTCIDAQHGPSAGWWRMVRYVMQELDQEQPLFNQLSLANDLERSLIKGLILSQPSNYSGALESCSDVRIPGFVLQARRFIEGNAELDITLDDIQRAAGVSPQRLHTAFKQQFGLSPLGYLKRFRLEAVRASLLEARGAYNVSATALRWGFTHLGRFSDHYQRVFGESPSKTLARGRR